MNELALLLVAPVLAGLGALVFIVLLTPFAQRFRLLDIPDNRKLHNAPVPMVGGLAIYLVIVSGFALFDPPIKAHWFAFALTLLLGVGLLDDAFGLGIKTRIFAQFIGSLVMVFGADLSIQSVGLGLPWDGALGLLGVSITLFAVIGLTNGFNMVDGIDGLASGHLLIGILSLVGIQVWMFGGVHQGIWLSVLFAAVFGFWLVNMSLTPLKQVFLGDSGSLLLGFIMSWLLVYYSQAPVARIEPVAALWCVSLPVMDTLVVIVRRLKNRRSPFSSDRNHLHHLLVDQGVHPTKALGCILLFATVVNLVGILATYHISPVFGFFTFACALLLFGYFMLHPEFERRLLLKVGLIE